MMELPSPVEEQTTATEAFRQAQNDLFERPRRRRPSSSKSRSHATASEAAEIQQTLGRTQTMLREQLRRTASVHTAIRDDEKLLKATLDTHQTLNVKQARKALTALERAQQRERRYLAAAVFFFWSAVFYVAWCRVLIKIPFLDRVLLLVPFVLRRLKDGMELLYDYILIPLLNRVRDGMEMAYESLLELWDQHHQ